MDPDEPRVRGLPNFRDAGGLPLAGGLRLRRRRVFRSELPTRLDRQDEVSLEGLGIGLVCDLRTDRERLRRPARVHPGARHVHHPLHEDPRYDVGLRDLARFLARREGERLFHELVTRYYRHLLLERAGALGALLESVAAHAPAAAWIHCTAGRDRTGLAVAILQSALGAREVDVLAGFRETDVRYGPRLARLTRALRALTLGRASEARLQVVLRTQPEILGARLAELTARHGSIEGYVREACGVREASLARLRALLVEPTAAVTAGA